MAWPIIFSGRRPIVLGTWWLLVFDGHRPIMIVGGPAVSGRELSIRYRWVSDRLSVDSGSLMACG